MALPGGRIGASASGVHVRFDPLGSPTVDDDSANQDALQDERFASYAAPAEIVLHGRVPAGASPPPLPG
jgi:hypothetical protein